MKTQMLVFVPLSYSREYLSISVLSGRACLFGLFRTPSVGYSLLWN